MIRVARWPYGSVQGVTDAGRHVLHGRQDHVTLNGVDRWIGGVPLAGPAVPWRWNEGTESIKPV
ncbi:hypothetical protein OHA25_37860 [Nonomuraea sp. NBC_00507]|uniref:hypothetical protein n=1 Tax=Nonomuraea sp. NBC_00507 TaxID=2976002 RepID=UPI002E17DEB5